MTYAVELHRYLNPYSNEFIYRWSTYDYSGFARYTGNPDWLRNPAKLTQLEIEYVTSHFTALTPPSVQTFIHQNNVQFTDGVYKLIKGL